VRPHVFAGVIEASGSGVKGFRPGDRVALGPANSCLKCGACLEGHPNVCPTGKSVGLPGFPGALQELVVHPAHPAFRLPDDMSFVGGPCSSRCGWPCTP
jgi:threonine dehydrogenase-like Zn-dependent dehydrogenase